MVLVKVAIFISMVTIGYHQIYSSTLMDVVQVAIFISTVTISYHQIYSSTLMLSVQVAIFISTVTITCMFGSDDDLSLNAPS